MIQKNQDFKRPAVSFFIKAQQIDPHAFDYEVIFHKSKLKNIIQLSKEKS